MTNSDDYAVSPSVQDAGCGTEVCAPCRSDVLDTAPDRKDYQLEPPVASKWDLPFSILHVTTAGQCLARRIDRPP
jgi:hypothetical protein